jgi:hypothetical protein
MIDAAVLRMIGIIEGFTHVKNANVHPTIKPVTPIGVPLSCVMFYLLIYPLSSSRCFYKVFTYRYRHIIRSY